MAFPSRKMLPLELVISFRGNRHPIGLIDPDAYNIMRMKAEALKVTSPYGLDSEEKIQLTVISPENKVKIVMDSDLVMRCLFAKHDSLGVIKFEVEVIPVLFPDFEGASLIQALLFNIGVQLPEQVITYLNEKPNKPLSRHHTEVNQGAQGERNAIGDDSDNSVEVDEDALLSDCEEKESCNKDEELVDEVAEQNHRLSATELIEDSDDNEGIDSKAIDEVDSSDVEDDNKEMMVVNSSDDESHLGTSKLMNYIEKHEYKVDKHGKHKLKLGDVFSDVAHFKFVLNEVMVRKGFDIQRVYSEPRRFRATCKSAGYPWFVNCTRLNDKTGFILREYNPKHECRMSKKSVKVQRRWIASKIKHQVTVDPHVKVSVLKEYMLETYGLRIKRLTMYRAREIARTEVQGDHSKGYEKLYQYAATIQQADPWAMCKVLCDAISMPENVLFQRFFVAFPAQRNAFLTGCRPFIGVDGCHLKSKYGGVLLAAVGIDANNGIVPLALCVCEVESTETWTWFLEHLNNYLDDGRQVTFISDRQKGLLNAIPNTRPTAYHRPCCRHVYANFAKEHHGVILRRLFWKAAKSTTKHDFQTTMEQIKSEKLEAFAWLEKELACYTWAMYEYDKNCKVDRTENNASECFNSWILAYRDKPCMTMLEEIRCRLMKRFTKRSKKAAKWTSQFPPKVDKTIDDICKLREKMNIVPSGDLNFEVKDKGFYPVRRFVVKLESKTCDCGYWEISGIPCAHAIAGILYARHKIEEYIPQCFSTHAYRNTYSVMFNPIPDQCTWESDGRPNIYPPIVRIPIGRPKKVRKMAANEPQRQARRFFVNCSFCNGSNHNVRSCLLRPNVSSATTVENRQVPIGRRKKSVNAGNITHNVRTTRRRGKASSVNQSQASQSSQA